MGSMPLKVSVIVEHAMGHTSIQEWTKEENYCPFCGKQSVWCYDDGADTYAPPPCFCTQCQKHFYYFTEITEDGTYYTRLLVSKLKGAE